MTEARDRVAAVMRRLNGAWLSGRLEDLAPLLHEDVVMALPGFTGRIQGKGPFLAGFRDFCENARVLQFHEDEHQIDMAAGVAVVSFTYAMLYERSGERYRVTGRELWIFREHDTGWLAVWRTMLDLNETSA